MENTIHFRTGRPTDAMSIKNFQLAMALETENLKLNEETLQKGVEGVFQNPERGQYHVCTINNEVVGNLLIIREWSDWRNGNVWWIHSLYIKPEHRGKGLYSEMYAYIKELAVQDSNVRGIRLYVDNSNAKAQAIYAKLGMNGDHYRLFEWMK